MRREPLSFWKEFRRLNSNEDLARFLIVCLALVGFIWLVSLAYRL